MTITLTAGADARRHAIESTATTTPPSGPQRSQRFAASHMRAQVVQADGKEFARLQGCASVVERGYEMWDMFGEYTEIVDAAAFDQTLAANPDVVFLLNHAGLAMARTTNGSLELSVDEEGLQTTAMLNPQRSDVADLLAAIEDGIVTEMSFAFRIEAGQWSPDYSEYRIMRVDIDRGDVSAVNYGANPHTSIAARTRQLFDAIDVLDGPALRAAHQRLTAKLGDNPAAPATGSQVALLRARLDLEADH